MSVTTTLQFVTPYAAAKLVNAQLADAGIDKVLPPQMFYNYTTARVRKGKAPFIACSEQGIELNDLAAWCEKYIAKQA